MTVTEIVLLGLVPISLLVMMVVATVHYDYGFDFHGSLYRAAQDIVSGQNPYPPPTPGAVIPSDMFVYPPTVALLAVPLGFLPYPWAAAVMTVVLIAVMAVALLVLGVRDWRCHGATLASILLLHDVRLLAITPFIVLGIALMWRLRDSASASAPFAFTVVAKLFVWPLGIWMLATGRARAAWAAVALTAMLIIGSWAMIGFVGMADYSHLLGILSDEKQEDGYSVVAAASAVGIDGLASRAVALGVGAALLLMAYREGRHDRDLPSFMWAIAACFALTPIVWLHYFLILYVPIAIRSPRFSIGWLFPLAFWVTPFEENFGSPWRIWYAGAVTVGVLVWAARCVRQEAKTAPEPLVAVNA